MSSTNSNYEKYKLNKVIKQNMKILTYEIHMSYKNTVVIKL